MTFLFNTIGGYSTVRTSAFAGGKTSMFVSPNFSICCMKCHISKTQLSVRPRDLGPSFSGLALWDSLLDGLIHLLTAFQTLLAGQIHLLTTFTGLPGRPEPRTHQNSDQIYDLIADQISCSKFLRPVHQTISPSHFATVLWWVRSS